MKYINIKIIQQFSKQIKFLAVGGISALTDMIILWFCSYVLQIRLNVSISIAYTMSAIVHFSCNRQIVFKNATTSFRKSIIRYIMLLMVNYMTNVIVINIFVAKFNMYLLIAKILAIGIGTVISYIFLNFYVFKGNHKEFHKERGCKKMNEEILQKEELFHDEWANSIRLDEVMVDEFFEACTSPENRQIMEWLGDVRGKKVLELGCGLGEGSVYMAKRGAKVTATDLSGGMLKLAKEVAERHGTSIETVKCSADNLPFESNTFDIVYAANLLHHVDVEVTLRESYRVLKKGGIFVSWDPIDYNPIIKIYRSMASGVRTVDEHPLRLKDIKTFKKIFSNVTYKGKWFFTNWIFVKFYFFNKINPSKERYWKLILKKHEELQPLYCKLEAVDRKVLSFIPSLKWLCWNIVVKARK